MIKKLNFALKTPGSLILYVMLINPIKQFLLINPIKGCVTSTIFLSFYTRSVVTVVLTVLS